MRFQEHLDKMDEANSMEVKQIADNFVRFLIGDRKQALNNLNKLIKANIPLPSDVQDPEVYNSLYGKLFKDISKTIEKNI